MNHLIVCDEYPPAPGGGIGTYAFHISRLLAAHGETVHVVAPLGSASLAREEQLGGHLVVHRIPSEAWDEDKNGYLTEEDLNIARQLEGVLPSHGFAWAAGVVCERLVAQEGIELIEAQEYAGLLYFFQLRRILGLGPGRNPPTLVHLHSPTEFIARYNGWDVHSPDVTLRKRLEDFSIATADRLLCPSRYLGSQAVRHYRLNSEQLEVIPYPVGDTRILDRSPGTWSGGTILYIGRLEPRKGVLEWVDAALELAEERPGLQFEFVGLDRPYRGSLTVGDVIRRRVPDRLKESFRLYGERQRADVSTFLSRARIAVVPSTWDNFPYTCIEATGSGLPVLATREGGMAEMIRDTESGWLAASPHPRDLAASLRAALDTEPERLAAMGSRAAQDIQELCGSEQILEQHLAFRRRVAKAGATRSLRLPPAHEPAVRERRPPPRDEAPAAAGGTAIVICAGGEERFTARTLDFVRRLDPPACAVAVVDQCSDGDVAGARPGRAVEPHWLLLRPGRDGSVSTENLAVQALLEHDPKITGIVFVRSGDYLRSDSIGVVEGVLKHCPEVGLVSSWSKPSSGAPQFDPNPAFPHQAVRDGAAGWSAVRTEAFTQVLGSSAELSDGYRSWDLHNALMLGGWQAVTVPLVLAEVEAATLDPTVDRHLQGVMREKILDRIRESGQCDLKEVILISEAAARFTPVPSPSWRTELQRRVEAELLEHLPVAITDRLRGVKRRLRNLR